MRIACFQDRHCSNIHFSKRGPHLLPTSATHQLRSEYEGTTVCAQGRAYNTRLCECARVRGCFDASRFHYFPVRSLEPQARWVRHGLMPSCSERMRKRIEGAHLHQTNGIRAVPRRLARSIETVLKRGIKQCCFLSFLRDVTGKLSVSGRPVQTTKNPPCARARWKQERAMRTSIPM